MHTFVQKPKATQKTASAKTMLPARARFGQTREVKSILHLQRTIGNQGVLRMLEANTGDAREHSTTTEIARFGHDFSRIPVHTRTPANDDAKQQKLTEPAGGGAPGSSLPLPADYLRHYGTDARGGHGEGVLEDQRPGSTPPATGGGTSPASPARPTPINVRNGPRHAPVNSGGRVGMSIAITISSSSGRDADMSGIQDSEQVGLSYNHTGSMSSLPALPSSQSGFMPGHPIPDDKHTAPKSFIIDRADNYGGSGSLEKKQLDIYKDAAAGVTTPRAIPASGYIIKRSITKTGTAISFRTEKRAAAATVNGYTTTAGPSPTQAENVVVRAAGLSRGAKTGIGIGGGAAVGAGIGALVGGPVGAGIGAVVGGIAGGIGSLFF